MRVSERCMKKILFGYLVMCLAVPILSSCLWSSGDVASRDSSPKMEVATEPELFWNCDARNVLNVGSIRYRELPGFSRPVPSELVLSLTSSGQVFNLEGPLRAVRYARSSRQVGPSTLDLHAFQFEFAEGSSIRWEDENGQPQNAPVSRIVVNTFPREGDERMGGNVRIHPRRGTASVPANLWFNNSCYFFNVGGKFLSIDELVTKKVIQLPLADIPSVEGGQRTSVPQTPPTVESPNDDL